MGLCAQGQLVCINNALECQVTIEPGTRRESCANPGVDNDCDGNGTELEDGVAAGTPCDGEFYGPCTGSPGMLGCAAGMVACVPTHPRNLESCDNRGVDDDCDGNAEEITDGFSEHEACSTSAIGRCGAGTMECLSSGALCVAPNTPRPETCFNVGTDDDCDGNVNELTEGVPHNTPCTTGMPAHCNTGRLACRGAESTTCVPTAGYTEVCDGVDNDCDTVTDECRGTMACAAGSCGCSTAAQCDDGGNDAAWVVGCAAPRCTITVGGIAITCGPGEAVNNNECTPP